jgi:hypothetical protein
VCEPGEYKKKLHDNNKNIQKDNILLANLEKKIKNLELNVAHNHFFFIFYFSSKMITNN